VEVNPEETKYKFMSRCQKAGPRQRIKIGNRSFESVAKFKYLGTALTDQKCIHEEIKSRLNPGNACYHSVQSLLSSRLLSTNAEVKTHKTIILIRQVKANEVGGACGTHVRGEKSVQGFGGKAGRKETTWKTKA
jgi:hypothetical protein